MKAATKKTAVALLSLVFAATILGTAAANTLPYFKVYGGDVMSGGWFNTGSVCSTAASSTYQDPKYKAPPTVNQNGGILTYTNVNGSQKPKGGASTEFAAYALGFIEYDNSKAWGYYSGGAITGTASINSNYLSFANSSTVTAPMGGLFEGLVRQSNCIPDYFTTQQRSPTSVAIGSVPDINTATGQFLVTPSGSLIDLNGDNNSSPKVIPAGAQTTIFVDGNVYIGSNITYDPAMTTNSVPKFTVIARGSIYIGKDVTQLDGLYIAQPASGYDPNRVVADDEGVIWTCHAHDANQMADSYPTSSCGSKLYVNGALIAKQVNLMRIKGNIASSPDPTSGSSEETLGAGLASNNIAEVINFSPAMIMGGGFFNPGNNTTLKVQSVISLPPIF
jgi:hypothetical protein